PPGPDGKPPYVVGQAIPGVEIKFLWGSRDDIVSYGSGQGLITLESRLKCVEVKMAGSMNRAYVLQYADSKSTGRSMLTQIQQVGSDARICETPSGCGGGVLYG